MKNVKIEIPKGYEIDESKSTFTNIVFKKIEDKYPNSVLDIEGRYWYSGPVRAISLNLTSNDLNQVSTEERAEAFLALMQLVELRDAYNKVDGFMADWSSCEQDKHCVFVCDNELSNQVFHTANMRLYFGSAKTRDLFYEKHIDLIEKAKELL
jgi:hypothetical protein